MEYMPKVSTSSTRRAKNSVRLFKKLFLLEADWLIIYGQITWSFLEYGRQVTRLRRHRRRRRRRRAYAPTNNTASHDNHEKILHGFPFLSRDDYGAPFGGPSGRRSFAINHFAFSLITYNANLSGVRGRMQPSLLVVLICLSWSTSR